MHLELKDSYIKDSFSVDREMGTLKIYSCGPTVYNYQSIGNMRAVWLPDTIVKVASMAGYDTHWVLNITDVGHLVSDGDDGEDKIEKGAKREGKTVKEVVEHYTKNFKKQCSALNFDLPSGKNNPKATEYIKEQIVLVVDLLIQGKAYVLEDGIYFSYKNSLPYLETLSQEHPLLKVLLEKIEKQQSGDNNNFTGRDIKNVSKDSSDFALWKFVPENTLQKWSLSNFKDHKSVRLYELVNKLDESEYKRVLDSWGCPGWHSECVCMIAGVFDEKFSESCDFNEVNNSKEVISIHTGGEDHIDVHHKNEILQSFALGFNLSQNWVHNRFVMVDGGKMSKSLDNIYLVVGNKSETGFKSIEEEGYNPLAYRLMLMETKYDQRLDFTWDKLEKSQARMYNLRKESAKILGLIENSIEGDVSVYNEDVYENQDYKSMLKVLLDNLNTPRFLEMYQSLLINVANECQKCITDKGFLDSSSDRELFVKITVLGYLETNFLQCGLFLAPEEGIVSTAEDRMKAKESKDWELADEIRAEIYNQGWQMDDLVKGKYSLWEK